MTGIICYLVKRSGFWREIMGEVICWKPILDSYYVHKETNKRISEVYGLNWQSRLYIRFPAYTFSGCSCEACGGWMISKFMDRRSSLSSQVPRFDLFQDDFPLPDALANKYRDFRDEYDFGAITTREGYLVTLPTCGRCDHVPLVSCHCYTCKATRWTTETTSLSVH